MQIGIIGWGNIASALASYIARDEALARVRLTALVRPGRTAPVPVVHDARALVAARPDLVIECAGHAGVADHVPACLAAGIESVVASIGALADDALAIALDEAAARGRTRYVLPAGALGGVDMLAALAPARIDAVTYEGRKPPSAWKGSPAETLVDLDALSAPATFFEGTAREAALRFPKNANVAATLALAGIGWEATQVRLAADPDAPGNTHRYEVEATAARMHVEVTGRALPENPRTSAATVLSLLREVRNRAGTRAI